ARLLRCLPGRRLHRRVGGWSQRTGLAPVARKAGRARRRPIGLASAAAELPPPQLAAFSGFTVFFAGAAFLPPAADFLLPAAASSLGDSRVSPTALAASRLALSASARLTAGVAVISRVAGATSSLPCTLASTTCASASRYPSWCASGSK